MIRVIIAGVMMILGLALLGVSAAGMFRFSTTMNRLHAVSKCGTLGVIAAMTGVMVISGLNAYSAKILAAMAFVWWCSPVVARLTASEEVRTNQNIEAVCDYVDLTEGANANDGD